MRNSVLDIDMTAITDEGALADEIDAVEASEEDTSIKKGTWFTYNQTNDLFEGPFKTKGDAIEAARESFSSNTDDEATVWLCQSVQKVIFTRKVHVVESDG